MLYLNIQKLFNPKIFKITFHADFQCFNQQDQKTEEEKTEDRKHQDKMVELC